MGTQYKMFRFTWILIFLLSQAVFVLAGPPPEQTLSGTISGVLTKAQSPYYAIDNITVDDGEELIIEPGVTILFYPNCRFHIGKGWVAQKVSPQFTAIGTKEDSIVFRALDPGKGWGGLQFNMSGSNDTLSFVVIKEVQAIQSHNSWSLTAGAISILNSSPLIRNSAIRNNYVENTPLFNFFDYTSISPQNFDPCSPHLQNCVITGNYCSEERSFGGPIFSSMQVTALLENLLVANNQMGHFITYGGATVQAFINITVTQNKLNYNPFMGVFLGGSGNVMILFKNSIIYHNDSDFHSLFCGPGKGDILQFEYSDIDTNLVNISWNAEKEQWDSVRTVWLPSDEIIWGDGNIAEDPLFFDEAKPDFTLREYSPCVDAGDPLLVYQDRVDPNFPDCALYPAQGSSKNDMGAYGGKSDLPYPWGSTAVARQTRAVNRYSLGENYPNPFNPETVIPYRLGERNFVSIHIYDLLGRCIRTLVHTVEEAGAHEVIWDGRDQSGNPMSSGIYTFRIETDCFAKTKKMVLIR